MPPFVYQTPVNPYAPSIADLELRRGDIAARGAERVGAIQALAAQQAGALWSRAISGAGAAIGGAIEQVNDPQRKLAELRVRQAQQEQTGRTAFDAMMQGDQLPPGDAGPRQESMLTPDGLFDVSKMSARLNQLGLAHMAPELLKGAEGINDSITKHVQQQQEIGKTQTILRGNIADGAIRLMKAGVPLADALDLAVQPALATKSVALQDYAQIRSQLLALPPEQQQTALDAFRDAAAKLSPTKTLAEGATEYDIYGRPMATGAPKAPTKAELAARAADPTLSPDQRGTAQAALDKLTPTPKRTDAELALDAYAKSIGKARAEELTYAERQQFEKNKATITSDQAFAQHQRERQYDIANPIPEKAANQDKLEQEYRTVLTRAVSSRSGGLGLEDQKVQQANHLLALLDQTYDPKSGTYTIPKTLQGELAAGLARLVAPGGNVGIEMMREFDQRTAKGDIAGALSYITGHPFPTAPQDFAQLLKDSIERQGSVAMENREGEMRYLRGLAPTDLKEGRRTALEANTLNPLRQSRVIQNKQTGERRLQVSIDGGKTWK